MDSIVDFCDKNNIRNWCVRDQGGISYIDVDGDVDLSTTEITIIPYRFGVVSGDFKCYKNNLTTLKNAPVEIGKNFIGGGNASLNSLEHLSFVHENVNVYMCNITAIVNINAISIYIKGNPAYHIYKHIYGARGTNWLDVCDMSGFFDFRIINGVDLNIKRFREYLSIMGNDDELPLEIEILSEHYNLIYG